MDGRGSRRLAGDGCCTYQLRRRAKRSPTQLVSVGVRAEDSGMRRPAVIPLLLLLIAVSCASTHRAAPSPAALRQACVERWNWLHYDHAFVPPPNRSAPVTVKTRPCRIEIDYRLSRYDPLYKTYLGMYFPCVLNRFLAYVCAEHATGLPGARPRRGQNGRYFAPTGRIQLRRPPTEPVSVPKPD